MFRTTPLPDSPDLTIMRTSATLLGRRLMWVHFVRVDDVFIDSGNRRCDRRALAGHLRAILGTLTVEQLYRDREAFAQKVQEVSGDDMASMGLEIVSFVIKDISDSEGYLEALGRPRIAQVKRDAAIGEAEAARDATIESARARQDRCNPLANLRAS